MKSRLFALLLIPVFCLAEDYVLGPDSHRHPGVPAGKITRYTWNRSKIFPGTTRNYWVYVPAQYDGATPACVMVFQDGGAFAKEEGPYHAPAVLDNLIHQHAIPVTIAILIDPGVVEAASPGQQNRFNRSYEYDGLGDRYVRFLLEEILPEVAKHYRLSADPSNRAIVGSSSGGIAAFTAAWERPDAFRRVLSFVGSFTDLRGGDWYINLIRKMEPKPLRVFLQDGSSDLNLYSGAWFLANQSMAAALTYAGYDVKFVTGTEGHNAKHGSAILPDALRWLWRGYPQGISAGHGGPVERHYITEILDPDQDWEPAKDRIPGIPRTSVAERHDGRRYLLVGAERKIWLVDRNGKRRPAFDGATAEGPRKPNAIRLCPDESLLVVTDAASRFVWSYKVQADGALTDGEPFYRLEAPDDPAEAGARAIAFDTEGYAYFATASGIQICDQPGRVVGIIRNPGPAAVSKLALGGEGFRTLYATEGGRVYRRRLRRKGPAPGETVSLPRPKL